MLHRVVVLLVLLSSLQSGKLQSEEPSSAGESNAGVAEVFDEIKALLSTIKSKTNTQIREFRSFRDQIEDNLRSLRGDLSSLNDSVNNLSMCLQEHKQQTAAELAQLQTSTQSSIATHTQQVNAKLNTLTTSLFQNKQETAAELVQLQTSLNTTQSSHASHAQQVNAKLNTLATSLSQHKQQTAADAQQLNSRLDTLTIIQQCDSKQDSTTQTTITTPDCFTVTATSFTIPTTTSTPTTPTATPTPTNPTYTCGGTGGWRRVVYVDMTDPTTTCPSGWQLTGYSKRTCGRATDGENTCDSVTFPVSGGEYSRVCGRIKAYQWGSTEAFRTYHSGRATTIDSAYVTGMSVTHGNPRQHVWTFAAGAGESNPGEIWVCPCDSSVTIRIPPFVGSDYFCESGLNGRWIGNYRLYSNDPLWDGEDCLSSSTCCAFNNPPYFVKQLPASTNDDIEARICMANVLRYKNLAVELVELYVQ